MFDIGFWELGIIGLVALVVIGPERLPGVARTVGRWVGGGRRMISALKEDIEKEIDIEELKQAVQKETRGNVVEELVGDVQQTVGELNRDTQKIMNDNRRTFESDNEEQLEPEKNDGK
jgi:sec-independent protein translocase protein TatB